MAYTEEWGSDSEASVDPDEDSQAWLHSCCQLAMLNQKFLSGGPAKTGEAEKIGIPGGLLRVSGLYPAIRFIPGR